MPAFDDMLALEDQRISLEEDIEAREKMLPKLKMQLMEAEGALKQNTNSILEWRATLRDIRGSDVDLVVLSEYLEVRSALADCIDTRQHFQGEVQKLTKDVAVMEKSIPVLTTRLAEVRRRLVTYCKLLQFRRP